MIKQSEKHTLLVQNFLLFGGAGRRSGVGGCGLTRFVLAGKFRGQLLVRLHLCLSLKITSLAFESLVGRASHAHHISTEMYLVMESELLLWHVGEKHLLPILGRYKRNEHRVTQIIVQLRQHPGPLL